MTPRDVRTGCQEATPATPATPDPKYPYKGYERIFAALRLRIRKITYRHRGGLRHDVALERPLGGELDEPGTHHALGVLCKD
jgi:hypothetical protein